MLALRGQEEMRRCSLYTNLGEVGVIHGVIFTLVAPFRHSRYLCQTKRLSLASAFPISLLHLLQHLQHDQTQR